MTITVNPDLNLVVEQPLSRLPLAVVKLPRGPKVPIWVQFARDGAVIDPSEALTSGTLVVGLYYKITAFVAGDSFTNVGAASNATSVYFLCTGTTPTTWTNSSTLQQCDSAGVLFSLIFSVKKNGEYDGAVLVLATGTDFTKFGTGTSTIFKSKCSFSTAEINTLLGVDASVANDESEVTLMGEVSWLGPDESKAFPFQIDLQNDSYKTNDVVTSTPGVQAMSLVTTSAEAILTGSRVITGSSTVTVTLATGLVTLSVPSELVVPSQTGNSGKYLTTNGAATSWGTVTGGVTSVAQSFTGGLISVAGSPITASGTLALTVAGTSGGIPYFSSATTWATSAALAASALVVGGGAGAAPATVTTGANVLTALGVAVGSAGAFITFNGDAGTPSALVGTNITGTASGLTAGNSTLAATVTVANEATDTTCFPLFVTAATGSLAAMSSAVLTFNSATGLLSATGLAGAFNGTVGATTPSTVAGTTGTFSGAVTGLTFNAVPLNRGLGDAVRNVALGDYALAVSTTGNRDTAIGRGAMASVTIGDDNVAIGANSLFQNVSGNTNTAVGAEALFSATGSGNVALGYFAGFYETASDSLYIDNQNRTNTAGDKAKALIYGTFAATAATQQLTINAGTITLNGSAVTATSFSGAGSGLTALNASNVSSGTLAAARGGTGVSNTGTITLGGNLVTTGAFNTTFAQAATTTVTLPSTSATMARTDAAQTFTGVQSMTSPAITTSITTPSTTFAIANATATTLNIGGAATTIAMGAAGAGTMNIPLTTSASSATTGALTIGNGTAATNVGIGGGNINAGGTIASGGAFNVAVSGLVDQVLLQRNGSTVIRTGSNNSELYTNYTLNSASVKIQQGSYLMLTGPGPSVDTSLSRNAAGVLQIGNASANATGSLVLTNLTASGTLAVTGATTLTGNLTSNGARISTPQALSGNGAVAAVNLTTEITTIANTGTANTTTTLAAGTNGQKKVISFITDGGFDAVITVTNPAWGGAGTITMNDALDNIELRYLNSVWQVFINNGCTLA